MNRFLTSSLGKKVVMSLTGLFLISFLVVHCGINALMFYNDGGVNFNAGAEFMGTNPIIRAVEIVLFIGLVLHIYQALILTLDNNRARPVKYAVNAANENSKWYSRSMGLLGTLILMFLIIHLKHFWVTSRFTDQITGGHTTLFDEMKVVFSEAWVVVLYDLAMISLAYHLLHGFYSAFQTLGLNNKKYTPVINLVGTAFSIIIPFIFAIMPLAMYMGWVK
ncbi:MAG: succinate dehydrogenase cytochrome b subunit [Bacteroidetes bacterium]|nr:succinate dehydrogenase cytochrome b subunit [Bacteroidota bacterium]